MDGFVSDLRWTLRLLARSPGFTAAAVLSLALAIGAISAVFGFARALLAPTPHVERPEELVRAFVDWSNGLEFGAFSYPDYADLRDGNGVLSGFAVETPLPFQLATGGGAERLWGSIVSGNYFSVLGVEPSLGRAFLPEEDRTPGSHPVVVLGHGLWRRRFAGDPGVVGSTVSLNGRPFTVVGVGPRGFAGANAGLASDLWVPMMMQEAASPGRSALDAREVHWIGFAIGRLAPGISLEQAEAALDAGMATLAELYPESNAGARIVLYPEARSRLHPFVRGRFVGFLGLLGGVVGLVLLLAAANVAGLLLARATARRREVAVRLALGAGRGRLLRLLLTESLVLAAGAGAAGLALGAALARALAAIELPVHLPLAIAPRLDGGLVAFTGLVSLVTAVAFGVVPALVASRAELQPALKQGEVAGGGGAMAWRRILVAAQVALALVLLLGAGLLVASLAGAREIDVGFEPAHQLAASIDATLQGYDAERGGRLFRTLKERVEALPGVTAAGWADLVPLALRTYQTPAAPAGHSLPANAAAPSVDYNFVGPGYFPAMGVPLLAGRGFTDEDGPEAPPVAVVNRTLARRFWDDEAAVGRRLEVFGREHEVVGVAADGKYFSLGEEPRPYVYLSIERHYRGDRTLHVRAAGDPAPLLAAVAREVAALDPALPVYDLAPMDERLAFARLPASLAAVAGTAFAALALLLAAVGLYALLAYWVSRRRHEIGVRMALGAGRRGVVGMVVRQGMTVVVAGLALGLAAGAGLARLAAGLLYGVRPGEPAVYLAAVALLAATAFVAVWLPARRAARTDPMAALKAE